MKIPIISLAILGGQAALAAAEGGGNLGASLDQFQSFYTGYQFAQKRFFPSNLLIGYAPWLVKRFVLPIARPRLPMHGLPISIS